MIVSGRNRLGIVALALFLALGAGLFVRLLAAPPPQVEMAGYATSHAACVSAKCAA